VSETEYVIVGTPVYRAGSFVIGKFLENQRDIQKSYPSSELILATEQKDYIEELNGMLKHYGLRGEVFFFEIVRPDYARAQNWHTTCGREAIRQYIVSKTEASHLLFIDADMTCDSQVINILKKEIEGYDIVASGYPGRLYGIQTGGIGCSLFTRNALQKITFRCIEFYNHRVIDEGEVLEMDAFSKRLKFKYGYLLAVDHYNTDGRARHIEPHPVSMLRKISNARLFRYMLMKTSIMFKFSIASSLHGFLSRLFQHR
jgi:hypothetical protein